MGGRIKTLNMASVSSHPNVEVRGSKGSGAAGRGLYATKSFAPGELITTFADPILGENRLSHPVLPTTANAP